jgi:hypothetical protein
MGMVGFVPPPTPFVGLLQVEAMRASCDRHRFNGVVSEGEQGEGAGRPFLAEGVGMVIALLDKGAFDHRRYTIVNRLRRLHDSDDFASLPEDLRERIREIIADSAR